MQTARSHFAKNLRAARKRAGISQQQLAELSELHRTEVSLLERAQRSPRLETIVALSRSLSLESQSALLEGVECGEPLEDASGPAAASGEPR